MSQLRELLILRHGKSDWKQELDDFERPLAERGKKATLKVLRWLEDQKLLPDLILSSTAKRATQTVRRINPDNQINTLYLDELYLAELDTLLQTLAQSPQAQRILLVGHNPGLEKLVSFLAHDQSEETATVETKRFPTAALAVFIMPNDWTQLSAGAGKLVNLIRPRELSVTAQ
ncbi:SixA phosphatase family protein [Thiosulfativibrio zosterae]|uniref:Phosphoglycerate mutase n=1 Tax=Thiosulfativibrio zosterae TaxID=2675053 RepID=A0A6F8PKF9_9GAMM|nr:histidine phosphatase family protein [Thiosulfativibrio zosterae]BBP42566.1 phosphoglycerate mutase [Thiosulfativibrio zosterae]